MCSREPHNACQTAAHVVAGARRVGDQLAMEPDLRCRNVVLPCLGAHEVLQRVELCRCRLQLRVIAEERDVERVAGIVLGVGVAGVLLGSAGENPSVPIDEVMVGNVWPPLAPPRPTQQQPHLLLPALVGTVVDRIMVDDDATRMLRGERIGPWRGRIPCRPGNDCGRPSARASKVRGADQEHHQRQQAVHPPERMPALVAQKRQRSFSDRQ